MRLLIQNLVLPTEPKHKTCCELFYRGGVGIFHGRGGRKGATGGEVGHRDNDLPQGGFCPEECGAD